MRPSLRLFSGSACVPISAGGRAGPSQPGDALSVVDALLPRWCFRSAAPSDPQDHAKKQELDGQGTDYHHVDGNKDSHRALITISRRGSGYLPDRLSRCGSLRRGSRWSEGQAAD
jgi:hypothetical protein